MSKDEWKRKTKKRDRDEKSGGRATKLAVTC